MRVSGVSAYSNQQKNNNTFGKVTIGKKIQYDLHMAVANRYAHTLDQAYYKGKTFLRVYKELQKPIDLVGKDRITFDNPEKQKIYDNFLEKLGDEAKDININITGYRAVTAGEGPLTGFRETCYVSEFTMPSVSYGRREEQMLLPWYKADQPFILPPFSELKEFVLLTLRNEVNYVYERKLESKHGRLVKKLSPAEHEQLLAKTNALAKEIDALWA